MRRHAPLQNRCRTPSCSSTSSVSAASTTIPHTGSSSRPVVARDVLHQLLAPHGLPEQPDPALGDPHQLNGDVGLVPHAPRIAPRRRLRGGHRIRQRAHDVRGHLLPPRSGHGQPHHVARRVGRIGRGPVPRHPARRLVHQHLGQPPLRVQHRHRVAAVLHHQRVDHAPPQFPLLPPVQHPGRHVHVDEQHRPSSCLLACHPRLAPTSPPGRPARDGPRALPYSRGSNAPRRTARRGRTRRRPPTPDDARGRW